MRGFLAAGLLAGSASVVAQGADELKREIERRDAEIRRLKERLEAAEKRPAETQPQDDELNRALERTLVQEGLLVLPRGRFELQPQLSYAHWDRDRGALRYEWDASLTGRAGIGWESQLQVTVPYLHVATSSDSATDFGDVSLSATKQLAPERRGVPAVLASLGWVARTGQDPFSGHVPTGSGFNVLQAGVSVLKRADPLVYYGGATYSLPQARDYSGRRLEPGTSVGLRAGSALAATPYTSINLAVNLIFQGAAQIDGQRIPDSDTVLGTLQVGFGTVLSRSVMLNLGGEFRFSGPVPNFRLTVGLPLRF
jgi:hypothetical protein